jgi:predicted phage terminase large subunit-like protein
VTAVAKLEPGLHPKERDRRLAAAILYERRQMREHLSPFVRKTFEEINPGIGYKHNWHIDLISEHLEACYRREIKRLIINIAPRSFKSGAVSVAFPAWALGLDPTLRFMGASYEIGLQIQHSINTRDVMQSQWYRGLFPKTNIASDQNEKKLFATTQHGFRLSTSVGASKIGAGGDFLIVDDPLNPKQAVSDTERERANYWFDNTFTTRLNDKKEGVIIVIMQRLHESDLTGHLLRKGGWTHLNLPTVATTRTVIDFGSVHVVREAGDEKEPTRECLLHPDRDGPEEIKQARIDLGEFGFAAQHQQDPAPADGGIVKRIWWRYYNEDPKAIAATADMVIISVDATFKEATGSDFVAIQAWAKKGASCYLLAQAHARMSFTKTLATLKEFLAAWDMHWECLIEDKANGPAIIDMLREEVQALIPVNPKESKQARAAAVSPLVEAGNVLIPCRGFTEDGKPILEPWVEAFLLEWTKFPNGAHDDQVDACTQALLRLRQGQILLGKA